MNKSFLLIIIVIVAIAAIPRSVEVISGNYLFGFDQGLFFQDVKRIVVDHKLTLIGSFTGGQGGLFQGPGWYYLLSIPFFVSNGDPMSAMILMLLLGLATVAFAIYFSNKMSDKTTAIAIGLLIAISPAIIAQSRFIWPPFPISLLTVFYLFFIFKVLQGKEKYLLAATFAIGLMAHFEIATAVTFFVNFLLTIVPFLFFKRLVSIRFFLLSMLSFTLTLTPLILFNFRHEWIMFKGVLNMLPQGGEHRVTLKYIEHMFFNHLEVFKLNFFSSFYLNNYLWPGILAILTVGGAFYLKDKKIKSFHKWFMVYLLTTPITLFAVFMLYLWPIWQWWLLQLIIFYNFSLGIISVYLFKKRQARSLIIILYIFFLAAFIKETVMFYQKDFYDYGRTAKIKGKIDAIDYIYKDARGEKFGLLIFTPPVYTFAYDYLLWWYGEKKFGYIPHNEKRGTFYLLIEPDPHKPWTYKGWLETVVKTGKVISTTQLPSGFIVEKRIADY